jgi:N-formylglutamate deformylase
MLASPPMSTPLFTVGEPEGVETPLLVEIPHAGTHVPPQFLSEVVAPARALGRDADMYVDDLYCDATRQGASLLFSRTSRYVVDLNRSEQDIDSQSVVGGPASHNAPRGIIWRMTTEGERAIISPLSRDAFSARIEGIYRPYHGCLQQMIARKLERFGRAIVLAAHSMPSVGRRAHGDSGSGRADVVPGSRGRTSADSRIIDAVDAHARAAGFSVTHDEPYKGGYTTQHYGRPAQNVHVIQVELSRHLYMDEERLSKRAPDFDRVREWCRALVAKLGHVELG